MRTTSDDRREPRRDRRRRDGGRLLGLLLGLVGLLGPAASAQSPAGPGLNVGLALNRTTYLFSGTPDPIEVNINVANVTTGTVFASRTLISEPLHLKLIFTDPDGLLIAALQAGTVAQDAPPPPTIVVGDQYVQVEPIVAVAPEGGRAVTLPDARSFYRLTKPGFYTVTAQVSVATYPGIFRTDADGTPLGALEEALFHGALPANRVQFALVTDADGDGYAFPAPDPRVSGQTEVDCNDANAAVHPGAVEVPGDGLDNDCNPATRDTRQLTGLGPARVWDGLKSSDAVGLRQDLQVKVFLNSTQVGSGQLNNVPSGSSGFPNALLQTIPLSLAGGPVAVPPNAQLKVEVATRRTCFGGGHNSGTPRLWYNGRPIDSGPTRDAGTRLAVTIDGVTTTYFLRTSLALNPTAGAVRQFIDVPVNSQATCPGRPFTPFGTWSTTLP